MPVEETDELLREAILEEVKSSENPLELLKGMELQLEGVLRKTAGCEHVIAGEELIFYCRKQLMIVKRLILSTTDQKG